MGPARLAVDRAVKSVLAFALLTLFAAHASATARSCVESGGFPDNAALNAYVNNPSASSPGEIAIAQQSLERVLTCLWRGEQSADSEQLKSDIWYFLAFAGQPGSTILRRNNSYVESLYQAWSAERTSVDPNTSQDPAIRKIKATMPALPAPSGRIFIAYYHDLTQAPSTVRRSFENDTMGVTIRGRYIAIRGEPAYTRTVLSHELAHAYLISSIPLDVRNKLPDWFHEVLAIYFSGSAGTESIVAPNGTEVIRRDTLQYREYAEIARFLGARFSRNELGDLLAETLERGDIQRFLSRCGVASYIGLVDLAQVRQTHSNAFFWLAALFVVLIGGKYLGWWLDLLDINGERLLTRYYGWKGPFPQIDSDAAYGLINRYGRRFALRHVARLRGKRSRRPFHLYIEDVLNYRSRHGNKPPYARFADPDYAGPRPLPPPDFSSDLRE